jgi:hypothetical protein
MTQISPERILIQTEEVAANAAAASSTLNRVGATANFINLYQGNLREFMINGGYGGAIVPFLGAEGLVRYKFAWEIVDLYIYAGEVTSGSGTTILDIKWKPFSSGSYASIFSTTPKFNSSASQFETCGIGQTKTGFTAPVLSKTQFDANDQIRFDILGAVSNGFGCGIGFQFRPR